MTMHYKHRFVSFVGTDYICRKCGAVAHNTRQIQGWVDYADCISDDDPRCDITMKGVLEAIENDKFGIDNIDAVNNSIEEFEAWKDSGDVTPIPIIYTPFTFTEHKQFLDWLNSPDPVKTLWGIED